MKKSVVVGGCLLLGCASTSPSPAPPPAPSSAPPRIVEGPSAPPPSATSSNTPTVDPPGAAAVKAPIFSDDDCAADGDCRPQGTCHPARCLAIANAVATHRACKEMNVMERERGLVDALMASRSWRLRGELLDLLLADGERALTAERAVSSVEK